MKRCPECRRDYYDETLLYCLDDGTPLLDGPATGGGILADEPQTAILHDTAGPGEARTRAQIHTTTAQTDAENINKRGVNKLLLALLALVIIVLGGYFGYRYLAPAGQISSIAVLPFENIGGNADSEYLSDGLAESLIYRLSQIPDLNVSPRGSVFRYKGKPADPNTVGRELGVDAVMSGRVTQRGDNLTISVDLVDVRNKKTLWGEQFERKIADLLATQREIASAITDKLQLKLSGDKATGITKRYTDNNEAYQSYLKGRYYWNRRTGENIKKAIDEFKAAVDRDPNFALAYAGLADGYGILPEYAGVPETESLPLARSYAERAIAIDPQLAEPHATLGFLHNSSWQWADAEREYKRAIELNPNYATAYHWYSITLKNLGRYDESAAAIKRAQELDPLSGAIGCNVSMAHGIRGDHQAGADESLKLIALDPNFGRAYEYLGLSYFKLGRNDEAVASLEKAVELTGRQSIVLAELGYVYGAVGRRDLALAVLKELEEKHARRAAAGHHIAAVYAGLGEKDKAFEWLEKDVSARDGRVTTLRWEVQFEPLRTDPRFKELLRKMNLPESPV